MRLVVAAVGKPRNAGLQVAIQDYENRAARYWPLEVHEVREERAVGGSPDRVRSREGERLLERAGTASIVTCDQGGRQFSSEEFSAWLRDRRDLGHDVAFLIGGAFGLEREVVQRSVMSISLAPWTLAHELARLVLAEQLYRAGTIVRGEPYHK